MTSTARPLPTIIGPTENALRSLLLRHLSPSEIPTYEDWAIMNLVASTQDGDLGAVLSRALQVPEQRVGQMLVRLNDRGLIEERDDKSWRLTDHGAEVLRPLREQVSTMSASLVSGISEPDLQSARTVLDLIRSRALAELQESPSPDS